MPDQSNLSDTVSIAGASEAVAALASQAEQNAVSLTEGMDLSAPSPVETPSPLPAVQQARQAWNAEVANARAANQAAASFPARPSDTTLTAPADAPFDAAAYEAARHTGYFPASATSFSEPISASVQVVPASISAGGRPAPRYATYEDAAQAKSDILSDARNLYTARGDFGSIGTPYFNAEVQEAYQSAGLAPPLEKPGPYQEARAKAADLTQDLNDTYAAQNRYGDIGGQDYRRDLRGILHGAGLASAPEEDAAPGAYRQESERRSKVEEAAKNAYAARGDFDKIGGDDYKAYVQSSLEEAGLASPAEEKPRGVRGALANMREDFADPSGYGKLNYGYALQQVGQETAQYYAKTNSGQYLTEEQKASAAAGFLPGLGAIAGTAIGSAIEPGVGSWVGGMVGAGAGAAAQGIIGANDERGQATREAAERLAASLNATADTVGTFRGLLESTGAPIQSLSQGLSALQSTGPGVGVAAVAGAGRSALSEGEYYGADTAATAKFLSSSPALAPLAQQYRSQGELSRQNFQSVAQLALAEGDTAEFNTAQMQASRATLNSDPQYQALAKNQQADSASWGNQLNHWAAEAGHHLGFQWLGMSDEDPIVQDQLALDKRKAQVDAQTSLDDQKYINEFAGINQGRQGLIDAGLNTKIGQAGFATAQAQGASAAALRGLAPGIAASLDAAAASDQTIITTDTGILNGLATNDPTRGAFQTLINQARADQVQNPLAKAQLAKTVYETGLQEEEAGFGLSLTTQQSGLTRGVLSGAVLRPARRRRTRHRVY